MADKGMVEEVRGLIKEGYSLEKIRANLIKIGYSEADANEIISQATGEPTEDETPLLPPPAQANTGEAEQVELPPAKEEQSDEDLLLASADDSTPIMPTAPARLPDVERTGGDTGAPVENAENTPAAGVEKPRHHHRHNTPPKGEIPEADVPKAMGEETKPTPGAGKAIAILLGALVVIVIMAYFILLPKLGIALTL